MTAVYVTRPKAWVSYQETPEGRPTCEVFETDSGPVATGLVDANGDNLYRVVMRAPIGFAMPRARGNETADAPSRR